METGRGGRHLYEAKTPNIGCVLIKSGHLPTLAVSETCASGAHATRRRTVLWLLHEPGVEVGSWLAVLPVRCPSYCIFSALPGVA